MITYTAFITTEQPGQVADPGISVWASDSSQNCEHEVASDNSPDLSLSDGNGDLHRMNAATLLSRLGYALAGSWQDSGGQWGAVVEPVAA